MTIEWPFVWVEHFLLHSNCAYVCANRLALFFDVNFWPVVMMTISSNHFFLQLFISPVIQLKLQEEETVGEWCTSCALFVFFSSYFFFELLSSWWVLSRQLRSLCTDQCCCYCFDMEFSTIEILHWSALLQSSTQSRTDVCSALFCTILNDENKQINRRKENKKLHTHIEINRCFCWNWNGFIYIYANQLSCKYACYDLGYICTCCCCWWYLFCFFSSIFRLYRLDCSNFALFSQFFAASLSCEPFHFWNGIK